MQVKPPNQKETRGKRKKGEEWEERRGKKEREERRQMGETENEEKMKIEWQREEE